MASIFAVVGFAIAAPAHAGDGPSYDVPLLGAEPTIDGSVGTLEWSGAKKFSATFAGRSGDVLVGRSATKLFVAIAVPDADGPGSTSVFFDDNDDGISQPGEDVVSLTANGTAQDAFLSGELLAPVEDTLNGGTNDVEAKLSYYAGVAYIEYSHPLCSADDRHDICFLPPSLETDPPTKLGFTVGYRDAFFPAATNAARNWANLFIQPPDVTPPSVRLDAPTDALVAAGVKLAATAVDSGSGVDAVTFQYAPTVEGPWRTIASVASPPYETSWTSVPPDGAYWLRAVARDRVGNEADTTPKQVTLDTTGPDISVSCFAAGAVETAPCEWFTLASQLPVAVRWTIADGATIADQRYTTDGSDPLTSPTARQLTTELSFRVDTLLRIGAVDGLGNTSTKDVHIGIDLTPPSEDIHAEDAQNAFYDGKPGSQIWVGVKAGSFALVGGGSDPESGIASATLPDVSGVAGWTQKDVSATKRTYAFAEPVAVPPGLFQASVTNGAGLTSTEVPLRFERDGLIPTDDPVCAPAACSNPSGPVTVLFNVADGESGLARVVYTTDGSDPSATHGTDGTQVVVNTPDTTVKWWAVDNVGNELPIHSRTILQAGSSDQPQGGPTFTVNTALDHSDEGGCSLADCTLREAIVAANSFEGPAAVHFAIPTPAPVIRAETALPAITNATDVDARTQGGALGPPVTLDGSLVHGDGLLVTASNSSIRGFVVQHFSGIGIHVSGGTGDTVAGNWSGLDPTGIVAAGNAGDGIRVENASRATVTGNVSAANGGHGIFLLNSTGSFVGDNTSGLNAAGTAALGNRIDGIAVDGGSDNTIGDAESPNRSAGNANQGISIFGVSYPRTTGNTVADNVVGVGATGAPIPNGADGIRLFNATHTTVLRNTVRNNTAAGVSVFGASFGNTIRRNSLARNGGLGIDLGLDGVTPNDAGDVDVGPNGLVNFPGPIGGARLTTDPPALAIDAKLLASPLTGYTIDVYANATCDPSGHGEGETWLGQISVRTDAHGDAAILGNVAAAPLESLVTMTATDAAGNTSEFSVCAHVTAAGRATDDGTTLTLTDDAVASPPGATVVGLSNLSLTAVPPPTGSLGSAPVAAVDVQNVPVAAVPVAAVPVAAVGISIDAANAVGGIPLSELPLIPPDSWTTRLADTVLAGQPVQNLTFAQVLQLAPQAVDGSLPGKPALTMRTIDVRNSVLATIPVAAVAFGSIKLSDIPVDWCAAYAEAGITPCPNLTQQTVIAAALQGVPVAAVGMESVPVAAVNLAFSPVAAVPVAAVHIAGTPVAAVPVAAVAVAGSPVAAVPVAAVAAKSAAIAALPVAAVPVAAVDCTKIAGGCSPGTTIGDAVAAGAISGATLLDIASSLGDITLGDIADYLKDATFTVGELAPYLPTTITLRDLLLMLMPIASWNWEGADLAALDIQDHATEGGVVHETAAFTVAGSGGDAVLDVSVTLAPGARYVKGSTTLTPGATAPPEPERVGNVLTWHLAGLTFGTQYQLTFSQRPGLSLVHESAAATLDSNGLTTPKKSAPTDVLVSDATLEPNDTPATALPIKIDTLNLGYITRAGDVDDYSFNGAPGARYVIRLSHLHIDADVVVYGPPQQQIRSAPVAAVPVAAVQVGDPGAGPSNATRSLAPQNLADAPRANLPLLGASLNRGTEDEAVLVVSTGGGPITVQVSGFNGATSVDPYVLRVQELPAPTLPPCTPRAPSGGVGGTLPALSTFNGAKVLFLVNGKRIGDFYGAQAETDVLNAIQTRITNGSFNSIGFPAGIVRLDGSTDIQNAYSAWDANSCAPELANNVVSQIGTLIDGLRGADPALRYLVLVGSDPIMPSARLIDYTTLSNEADFASTFTTNNEYLGALGNGYMLSDAPYGSGTPQPYFNRQLYLPDLAVGRLVETPKQIVDQIDTFFASNGTLDPTSSATTGYDFLTDGAISVADQLHTNVGNDQRLLGESWTRPDALAQVFPSGAPSPGIVSLNAHYDQNLALPAIGNSSHASSDLISTTDFDGRTAPDGTTPALRRRILFTMGCHAGYNIAGVVEPGLNADWAETLATQQAVYLANLTYGLGDTAAVAYSEQYMTNFAHYLDGSMTVGEAQMNAAEDYFGALAMISPYDEKAGQAPALYGLPMYRFHTTKPPPPPPPQLPTQTDAVTGLTAASVTATPSFVFHHTSTGDFYTDGANNPQVTLYQPVEPRSAPVDATQPGTLAHGVRIDSLAVLRTEPITPHYDRPTIDQGANEPSFIPKNAAFPDNLAAVTTVNVPGGRRQQVVFLTGAFDGTDTPGGLGAGTQTLFSSIGATVLYSQGTDWTLPSIARVDSVVVPGHVSFTVEASDTGPASSVPAPGVSSVTVMYRDGTSQAYTSLTLTLANGVWTGTGPASSPTIEYFVQAIDRSGNVTITRNKARNFNAAPPGSGTSPTITLHVNGQPPTPGRFYSAAPVVVDAATSTNGILRFSVDGGALTDYTGAISVTGEGFHSVRFVDATSTAQVDFGIDTSAPTVTISTPRNGAILFILDKYKVDFECRDGGAGVASCVGTVPNGSLLPTLKLAGTYTFKVTATDTFGRTTTATSTYVLVPGITFLPPALGDPVLPTVLNIVKAGSTVPVRFSLVSNRGLDIFDPGYPRSQQVACRTGLVQNTIEPEPTPAGLRYDPRTTVYTYGFKTDPAWAGTCRDFTVKFRGGSTRTIRFKFR